MIRRALILLPLLLALASPARAAEGSLVGVRPVDPDQSWVVLTLAPGASQRAEALVVNLTDEPQRVRIGTADAVTTGDGVFTLAGDDEPRRGVGAWISPDQETVALGPRESRAVGFTVAVPRDAEPGDHSGGLLVRADQAAQTAGGDGVSVSIVERVGLRVLVEVPGTRDGEVSIDGASARPAGAGGVRGLLGLADGIDVAFTVRHTGNIRYSRLHALVELREGDAVRATAPIDLGTLLPGDSRDAQVRLPLSSWSTGGYDVRIRVGGIPEVRAEARASVGSERVYGAGVLAVGGLLLGAAGATRRRMRRGP